MITRPLYKGDNWCVDCIFYANASCGNPKQTIEEFKQYVYYSFGCDLHEKGTNPFIEGATEDEIKMIKSNQ